MLTFVEATENNNGIEVKNNLWLMNVAHIAIIIH